MELKHQNPNVYIIVTIIYGNCPSYTRDDSSHSTGPWLVMVAGEKHIQNAMGVCIWNREEPRNDS